MQVQQAFPAGGGAGAPGEQVLVRFAANRSLVKSLRLVEDGEPIERVPGTRNLFWFERDRVGEVTELRYDVKESYRGEYPAPAGPAIVLNSKDEREAQRADAESFRDELLDRLQEIAFGRHADFRRFFVAYDALTQPAIIDHLECGRLPGDPGLGVLFDGRPRPSFPTSEIDRVAEALQREFFPRAERFVELAPLPVSALAGDPAVAQLADYQLHIFDHWFPPRKEVPPVGLIEAFSSFANGELAFSRYYRQFNAEPDSGLFFGFAAFALLASQSECKRADYWRELFSIFVALQEVYLARYGPRLGERKWHSYYLDSNHQKSPRAVDPATIAKHLEHHRSRYAKDEHLIERMGETTYWAFQDEIDLREAWQRRMITRRGKGSRPAP